MTAAQPSIATIADGPAGSKLSQAAVDHAAGRGLSRATLVKAGVASGTAYFPALGQRREALWFRYGINQWKAVAFPDKAFIAKGTGLPFWNLERVLAAEPGDVFFTEGELDALSLVEAGIPIDRVLSVPTGASETKGVGGDPDEEITSQRGSRAQQRAFPYVVEALRGGLGRHHRFIWCGDMDGVGLALRAQMARMLGAGKFWFVDWPEGTKDANAFLTSDGPAALLDLVVHGPREWPVDGLFKLSELPEPPPLVLWDAGFASWSGKLCLADRSLCVVTGQPGNGKTLLMAQVIYQIVRAYNLVAVIATFETRAKPEYRRILRTLHSGRLEREMSAPDIAAADAWIDEHYLWLEHPTRQPPLEWLLDRAETAAVRHKAKIIQIDPWNRLESARDYREREDEYIGRCLKAMYGFAHDMNVHFQIIAHPAKLSGERRGRDEPGLEDIHGAKGWDSIPDQGIVVHRPAKFDPLRDVEAVVTHAKARFPALGRTCKLPMVFDLTAGRFVDGIGSTVKGIEGKDR